MIARIIEWSARNVLLVRAVESADRDRTLITEVDRQHAARFCLEGQAVQDLRFAVACGNVGQVKHRPKPPDRCP